MIGLLQECVDVFKAFSAGDVKQHTIDDGHKDVVGESCYNGSERAADNNADSHINNIAASYKFFEFAKKLFHNVSFL